jgi:ribosome-binding protein aMBF1 (putative translation factor)
MERSKAKHETSARKILLQDVFEGHPDRMDELAQTRREMALGMKIRRVREEAGLTQQELADMIGTQPSAISRIEDADYDGHSVALLERVAKALDLMLIIDFETKSPPNPRKAKME